MMVFDLLNERLLEDSQNVISKASSLEFTSNEKGLMVVFDGHISTFQLYKSYPNDRFFTLAKNSLVQVSTVPKSSNQILKLFSSILLSVDEMSDSAGSRFTFTNVSNQTLPVEIHAFSAGNNPISVSITNDAKLLTASFKKKIMIYDISDMKNVNILGSYGFDDLHDVLDAVFTSDGKTCYAVIRTRKGSLERDLNSELKVFDLSDPASIKEIDSFSSGINFLSISLNVSLILSKDEKTLFMVNLFVVRFDVSARVIEKSLDRRPLTLTFVASSASLSPNQKTLILKKEDLSSSALYLIDVSNLTTLTHLSSFSLPKTKTIKNIPVAFSPDSKFVYTEGIDNGKPALLVFDISDPFSPRFPNAIKVEGGSVDNFIISDDGLSAYFASDLENKIYATNLEVPNTVFFGTEKFPLGEKSSTEAMVLKQKAPGDYTHLNTKHKFVKASLFASRVNPSEFSTESTFTPFPYWMTFLKDSDRFIVEPKNDRDLGTYTFYSAFSTQLNLSSFDGIGTFDSNLDDTEIQALLATLISIGYLDSDLYVTGNLGTIDRFFLTNPYVHYKSAIYQVLKENYFEAFTVFDIVPSMDLVISKKVLQVRTPSENLLKIEIVLEPFSKNKDFQFLNKHYGSLVPLITKDKTKFSIEGSVDDINKALKKLVVNSYANGIECGGTITVWDHLNPSIQKTLKDLTRYFELNEAPGIGFDVQKQIDAKAIYTGEYFAIDFLNETFIDKYSEHLDITLTLDNKERSPAPNWIVFSDLALKGTAPEEVLKRKINLLLTVKNEFKKIEVPLTLNIKLSPMFLLKLLVRYSPYILTALGLWVFANRIYNVVKKDKYRHRKDFEIIAGQEITSQDIYPIRFLGQEGSESDLIWKNLLKKGKKEEWDKSNIMEEIKRVVQKLTEKELPLYKKGSSLSQKLINQLIMNQMALRLIDSEDEKETKRIYEEEIEDHLMDLVKWNENGYCEINESELAGILKNLNLDLNNNEEQEGMEVELISHRRVINVDLLKDVIIADAMKYQSVRKRVLFTHLIIKEEVPGNCIKRFLKKNLRDLEAAQKGQKTIYGIEYDIKNGVLHFSGTAEEMFCGKTIVVQITDRRHKILKEVWIHGVGKKEDHGELGNNYEML